MESDVISAFNSQLTFERFSADVYYSLACQLDFLNLTGLASYMHKRASEERSHAKKFSDYLADIEVMPEINALQKPTVDITSNANLSESALRAFTLALEHEKIVTGRIKSLYTLCEDDYQAQVFLHWFLAEQIEEEKTLNDIITRFGAGISTYEIDKEYRE